MEAHEKNIVKLRKTFGKETEEATNSHEEELGAIERKKSKEVTRAERRMEDKMKELDKQLEAAGVNHQEEVREARDASCSRFFSASMLVTRLTRPAHARYPAHINMTSTLTPPPPLADGGH